MKKIFLGLCLLFSQCMIAQEASQAPSIRTMFPGDYPDPSLLVDGKDYYIVHSSFEYYPGLTIWHSNDLKHWSPVQSPLRTYVGSVWAPDFVKYKGKYYIYFPAGTSNYVIWADSVNGKWSEPIDLQIGGIDPGHVVDAKGNRYLYFSNGGYTKLSKDGLHTEGNYIHVYDGWEIPREWSIECFCMEGPKLTKHGEYYYLTVAEGGTAGPATGHMVVSARSKSPLGSWENSPYNPLLRAKTPNEQWCSTGHATIFEDNNHQWWMLFHAYENGYYNMGRQTLIAPIEWTSDGWWKVPENAKFVSQEAECAFNLSDNFEGNTLRPHWRFWKEFEESRYTVAHNSLTLKGKGTDVVSSCPLLCMPQNHSYSVQVEMEISGDAIGGLLLYYSPKIYSGIMADSTNVLANLRGWQFPTEKNVHHNHVFLKLINNKHLVDMYYSLDGNNWTKLANSFNVEAYHHNVLGEFLALRIGLVSIGKGTVTFKNFVYKSL